MVLIVRGLTVIIRDPLGHMVSKTDEAVKTAFGQRIREIRTSKNLSQEGLAELCDLDRSYIGGVERGERNVSLVNIHLIAKALGVPVRDLFNA